MNERNHVTIQGWMRSELDLKGNELLIYAIIYGFSQTEDQKFTGSRQYLADWCGATKQGIDKNLKSLIEKGLISKEETTVNGVKYCSYKLSTSQLSCPNNIDNINNTVIDNHTLHTLHTQFIKPTVDDVKQYCIERHNTVDANKFIDYYTSNGWKVGKNPMKDWKAAVRTWERSGYNGKPQEPPKEKPEWAKRIKMV